jgi:CBS domain-containing protein
MNLRDLAMASAPQTLAVGASVRTVLEMMFEHRVNHVALVDGAGRFVGLAGIDAALNRVIPASARARQGLDNLAFAGDALPMLVDHYHALLDQPASLLIDLKVHPLPERTPLMEAALLLSRAHQPLPVVDDSGMLLGIISQRGLLQFFARDTESA